jgi:hypothetical protein
MSRRRATSNPISLFSFQDIITSVTGIMILVTLIMTLELIQRTVSSPLVQTVAVTVEAESTTADMRKRARDLKAQIERQQQAAESLRGVDPRGLNEQLQELEQTIEQFLKDVERVSAISAATERNRRQAATEEAETLAKLSEVRTIEQQIAAAQSELEKLKKTNRLIFNPDKSSAKTPWLLDVSSTQIKAAQVGVKATPAVFSGGSPAELLAQFGGWLPARDPAAEYFVLLIRPSAAELYLPLRFELQGQGFDLGFDLLGETQTVVDPETGAAP